MKNPVKLHIQTDEPEIYKSVQSILMKQINADKLQFVSENIPASFTVVVGKDKIFIETELFVDNLSQKSTLEKDLTYLQNFLESIDRKLSNERFLTNAKPDVIEIEKKKKADTEAKIRAIEESLQHLQ